MNFLSWIIFGLIAGVLAKWIMPGTYSIGIIMTIV
ncbi:GlsB/YeaQ/YmgE family stress response membrane protein, partial [Klebsiella pneumoniae]|nr:GlsB/YeaQ/YmgE family stress response membrane protein [Klebsiella pneumoniae]